MSEIELTADQANTLHGATDADTDFRYHAPGDASYFTEGQRQRHRLLTLAKALGNRLRVYQDGACTFGVRPGCLRDGAAEIDFAGAAAQPLTDDATNYVHLVLDGGEATLAVATDAFPDPADTPHLPLATIDVADGVFSQDDVIDCRQQAVFRLLSAATAGDLNTLVGGTSADALHTHAVAGLAGAVQDLLPSLSLSGADSADGTGTMSIQAKDAAGNDLTARLRVRCWLATSEYGAPAPAADFSVATGTQLAERTADADYEVITDATGLAVMNIDLSADATACVCAEVDGRIYSGSVAITGN